MKRLIAAARARAVENFSDEIVCAATLALYDALITGDPP